MSNKLASAVHLTKDGVVHSFLPGTTPPEWAAELIDNPKAWAGEPTKAAAQDVPPRRGKGSGADAWRTYADKHGQKFDEDATVKDIIAALDDAGIATEK